MKSYLAVSVIAAAVSGGALAQEAAVSGQKTAQPELIEKLYGSLQLRHVTRELVAEDGTTDGVPFFHIRPTLGTKLFNDKLDIAGTWVFVKPAGNTRLNRAALFFEATYDVYSNDNVSLYPYVYVEQGGADGFQYFQVGPHAETMAKVAVPGGSLKLNAYIEPLATFNSGKHAAGDKQKVPVTDRRDPGLALRDEEPAASKVEQQDPSLSNTVEVGATYDIAAVKGLSVALFADYMQNWNPKYVYEENGRDGKPSVEFDGYEVRDAVLNRFNVAYKINDSVTLANSLRYIVNGAYEDTYTKDIGINGLAYRVENRLTVTATLF